MGENEHCVLLRLTRLVRTGGVSHQKKKKRQFQNTLRNEYLLKNEAPVKYVCVEGRNNLVKPETVSFVLHLLCLWSFK